MNQSEKLYDEAIEAIKAGDKLKAKKMLESLVNEGYTKAYALYMRVCFDLSEFEDSLKYGKLASELNPEDELTNAITGLILYNGFEGCEANFEEAFPYYKRAADAGHMSSAARIGYMYCFGEGVEVDQEQARYYNNLAGKQGHVVAKFNNAYTYLREGKSFRGLFTMLRYFIPVKLAQIFQKEEKLFIN